MVDSTSPSRETADPTADPYAETRRGWGWLIQAVTGLLLIGLLALHMIANHFVVEGGLATYEEIVAYLRTPIILVLEVSFLFLVTWHGLLGLRAVIFDFGFSERTERRITAILWIVGVATVVYGLWLTAAVISG
jgi:succinate dehydrogenase / fumarate reductase, membrane anchor subunit